MMMTNDALDAVSGRNPDTTRKRLDEEESPVSPPAPKKIVSSKIEGLLFKLAHWIPVGNDSSTSLHLLLLGERSQPLSRLRPWQYGHDIQGYHCAHTELKQ